jgi:hypothetical protein
MKSRRNSKLKRKAATRSARRYFFLFSEGEKTERDYFRALQSVLDPKEVKIEYNGPLGVPKTVATRAIEAAKEKGLAKGRRGKKLNSFEENDEVWAVFDRDEFECYDEAKQMCTGAGISYAYSDPCFEIWLNLHFGDHEAPCTRHDAQAKSKELIEGYDPNSGKTGDFDTLVARVEQAEERAERQRRNRKDENNEDGNPSTSVYELTRKLRGKSEG